MRRDAANQPPLHDDIVRDDVRVENVALALDDKSSLGAEVFRDGIVDRVILQIDVTAAPLAHGGLRGDRRVLFRAAIETRHPPLLRRFDRRLARRLEQFLYAQILSALPAIRGNRGARFQLRMAAMRADYLRFV